MGPEPVSPVKDARLLPWALGTFHAAVLMLVPLALAYPRGTLGGILSGLGTLPGLALFAWLWLLSCWGARGALRAVRLDAPPRALVQDAIGHAFVWGGGVGALFLAGALLALLAATLPSITFSLPAVVATVMFGGFGLAAACAVGALVGMLFAALDAGLLLAARRLDGHAWGREGEEK